VRASLLVAVALSASVAHGYPFYSPRPVPTAIAGPTDPHVAAIFYNPAALGPLPGLHVWLDGGVRIHLGSIDRSPDASGQWSGSAPIRQADPEGFLGATYELSADRVTIGVATELPLVDLSSYGPSSPVRYHEIDQQLAALQQSIALGIRVSGRFYVGASVHFAESWLSWRFARDAAPAGGSAGVDQPGGLCGSSPCGLENPLAEQRIRLRGFGWYVGGSVGALVRPIDRLWLGAAYTFPIPMTLVDQSRAFVTPAPGQCAGCASVAGGDAIGFTMPDHVYLGVRVEVTPRIDFESWARYVHYSTRQQLDVALQGHMLAPFGVPPEQLYDRGLQDAAAVEASGRFRIRETLRLAPWLFYETAAVDPSAVNAAALDGHKVAVGLTAEWHPIRHLAVGANLGGVAYLLGDVRSRFSSLAEKTCVDAQYSLDACGKANAGQALPSASGHYTLFVINASAALGVDY
jgi:long-subunit fatty acid transport protein